MFISGGKIPYIRIGKSKLTIILNGEKFEQTLINVLHASQIDQNMISVKRSSQAGFKFIFDGKYCIM